LNFASVTTSSAPTATRLYGSSLRLPDKSDTRGMWNQYGSVPTDASEGVFAVLEDIQGTGAEFGTTGSLASLVGFAPGVSARIGSVKKEFLLEEALVAVPFKTLNGARQFISFPARNAALDPTQSQTYQKLEAAMDKYVFPPKFDFTRFDTVDPIMMYVFEFSAKLTQQDIADIWQNLPPDIAERFETQEAVVEEKELIDSIISKNEDIQWMVFKVKIRAKKDFEKYRRSLIPNADLSAFPDSVTSPYTYNWPYDYFSLVELAKIEETATYVSLDLKQDAPISELESLDTNRTSTGRSAAAGNRRSAAAAGNRRSARSSESPAGPTAQASPPLQKAPQKPVIAAPLDLQAALANARNRKKGGGK